MSGARDGSHRPAVRLSGLTEGPAEQLGPPGGVDAAPRGADTGG